MLNKSLNDFTVVFYQFRFLSLTIQPFWYLNSNHVDLTFSKLIIPIFFIFLHTTQYKSQHLLSSHRLRNIIELNTVLFYRPSMFWWYRVERFHQSHFRYCTFIAYRISTVDLRKVYYGVKLVQLNQFLHQVLSFSICI